MQNGIFKGEKRPIVTIVMDGVGLCRREAGNAVRTARTPTLDRLMANYKMFSLKAHGTAVGLPSGRRHGQQRGRPQRARRRARSSRRALSW